MPNRFVAALLLASITLAGCTGSRTAPAAKKDGTPSYAFITNGVADFWEHAEAGAKKAAEELKVDVTVITPSSITDQTRKVQDLLTRGTNGIAISPIDAANQVDVLNSAAKQTNLVTHDSDAPASDRLVYIGMDNYDAGLLCGKTLREAMPEGGDVMILVGRIEQDNAKGRRQGFIDGFVGREPDPKRNDPPGAEVKSDDGKFVVLGTMTDNFDRAKAKANAEDAITRHPELGAIVGLFEYNPPAIYEALERTGKLGTVKLMGFDENPVLLQAIKDGNAVATIVQNPYEYGHKSVEVLNELHKGNQSVIPESKFIDIPARVIDKSNVDPFWKEMNERLGKK